MNINNKKYDGYKLVLVDLYKYQARKASFDATDTGWIESMRDLSIKKI